MSTLALTLIIYPNPNSPTNRRKTDRRNTYKKGLKTASQSWQRICWMSAVSGLNLQKQKSKQDKTNYTSSSTNTSTNTNININKRIKRK